MARESACVDALLGGAATALREKNLIKAEKLSPKNEATAATNTTPPLSKPDVPGTTQSLASCQIVEVSSTGSTSSSTAPNKIVLEHSDDVPYTQQIQMDYLEDEMLEIQNGRDHAPLLIPPMKFCHQETDTAMNFVEREEDMVDMEQDTVLL